MEEKKEKGAPVPAPKKPVYVARNASGDSDALTREYNDSLLFKQRLIGGTVPDLRTTIFGQTISSPIMPGPIGFPSEKYKPEVCIAEAVKRADSIMWAGMVGKDIQAIGARMVEITKPVDNIDQFYERIEKAKNKGCVAVGTDFDKAFGDDGYFDVSRNGEVRMHCLSLEEIKTAVQIAGDTPFVMKGVLSPEDAVACKEAGVSAIVVSTHHGLYPFAVPPLMILPEIRKAVGPEMTILVDSMIRDGYDAMKALCLGADAVLVARALMKPITSAGADGVYGFFQEANDQLRQMMARCGIADMKHMTPDVIIRK